MEINDKKDKEIEELKLECENKNNNNIRLKNLLKEYEKKFLMPKLDVMKTMKTKRVS